MLRPQCSSVKSVRPSSTLLAGVLMECEEEMIKPFMIQPKRTPRVITSYEGPMHPHSDILYEISFIKYDLFGPGEPD